MSILQKLTEGVQSRDMRAEGAALLNKWEATGLLEGLKKKKKKQGMACLLENQAKELLREASSMGAGDVEGFAAVAFPIVRRVFGGLIANDLVSVQPMSLPSGLIFFLDFTHESTRSGAEAGKSIYGGNVVGKEIIDGVTLGNTPGGFYDLGNSYANATGSAVTQALTALAGFGTSGKTTVGALTAAEKKVIKFDPDILSLPSTAGVAAFTLPALEEFADVGHPQALSASLANDDRVVRRLTTISSTRAPTIIVVSADGAVTAATTETKTISYALRDTVAGSGIGGVAAGAHPLEEPSPGTGNRARDNAGNSITEIDIKVDSIAVTAQTKKLKAKWSPELGQDLNAYHNLDAEVELTGILSEQIALEIDRELLDELVSGATAGTRYWSRAPGLFVDSAGSELGATSASPDFTGTVSEWYETLIETINDVSAQIHRKTLRGGANFVVCSPEVANILEFTSGFRASVTADTDRGTIGALKSGSLSKKFDVYVDPYFMRNVILIGRKGSSFLESGFVYAPYVPLQVTPTIFGTEDFVPRKGVMTRYGKKMVRPDMYGLVVVRGLLGEAGAS